MSDKKKIAPPTATDKNIDRELDSLKQILKSIENLTDVEKRRVFQYLKNKYSNTWPSAEY